MTIPYRTRSFLKRLGKFILIMAVLSAVLMVIGFFWLNRYVVYTRDGIKLDFSQSSSHISGVKVEKPVIENPISLYYHDGTDSPYAQKELEQITGYYITTQDLEQDFAGVVEQIQKIPTESAVMIDVKSIYGTFAYSSYASEERNVDIDTEAMDALIKQLNSGKHYTIARVPALRDRMFGLNHVENGLPVAAGYLWMDSMGCYWLDPTKDGTITYLVQIASELKNLGFDEVVFTDFYFPEAESIVFKKDKAESLAKAAQTLVNTCGANGFTVSFGIKQPFAFPEGKSRIILQDVSAADAESAAQAIEIDNPPARIMFLAENHDTRYDGYSVLRPISIVE